MRRLTALEKWRAYNRYEQLLNNMMAKIYACGRKGEKGK